jgi:hypothetical protein
VEVLCFLPSKPYPPYDFDLRATHARTLLPEALASVSFGFVLVRVRVPIVYRKNCIAYWFWLFLGPNSGGSYPLVVGPLLLRRGGAELMVARPAGGRRLRTREAVRGGRVEGLATLLLS